MIASVEWTARLIVALYYLFLVAFHRDTAEAWIVPAAVVAVIVAGADYWRRGHA